MTRRWPSDALMRAELARIRSSIELAGEMEQLLAGQPEQAPRDLPERQWYWSAHRGAHVKRGAVG